MRFRPIRRVGHVRPIDKAWDLLLREANDRLHARMAQYEAPEPRGMALQDLVIVYRLPTKQKEKVHRIADSDKILHIPDRAQKEPMPFSLGLLMAAGPEAMDVLLSHGTLPGDMVRFAPLAGDEETAARVDEAIQLAQSRGASEAEQEKAALAARDADMERKKLLRLKASDIHESLDLLDRLAGPLPTMEMVVEVNKAGEPITLIRPVTDDEGDAHAA